MIETVRLNNGTGEAKPLVAVTMMILQDIHSNDLPLLYDLYRLCEDSNYPILQARLDKLKRQQLVDTTGSVHSSIRHVVRSAVQVGGKADGDMVVRLRDPIARACAT